MALMYEIVEYFVKVCKCHLSLFLLLGWNKFGKFQLSHINRKTNAMNYNIPE